MLDIREINMEIARLEYEDSSYPNYQKLANLYTIRDKMEGNSYSNDYSRATAPPAPADYPNTFDLSGDSEFLELVRGRDSFAVWEIMDELMDTMRSVNGRVYDRVLDKIRSV